MGAESPSRSEVGKAGRVAKGDSGLAAPVWKARRPPLNSGAPWPTPDEAAARVLGIQRKLQRWACDDPTRRFPDLRNLVCDRATLLVAWSRVRGNRGSRSAGVDGETAAYVEQVLGVERFLEELWQELRAGEAYPRQAGVELGIGKSYATIKPSAIRWPRPLT